MWKWLNKAVRLLAAAVLLSFVCVWTTGYIVNSYIETVLKQFGLPLQVQPPGLTGFWGKLWGADQPAGSDSEKKPGVSGSALPGQSVSGIILPGISIPDFSASQNAASGNGNPASGYTDSGNSISSNSNSSNSNSSNSTSGTPSSGNTFPGNAEPFDFPHPHQPETEPPSNSAGAGSPDSVNQEDMPVFNGWGNAGEITEDDREILRSIMMQLNEEQLMQLARLMGGGWTESELKAAGKMLENTLNEEDYNILMEILSRTALLRKEPHQTAQDQAF